MNRKERRKYRKTLGAGFEIHSITMDEMGTKGAEILQKHPRAIMINISAQMRKFYAALDEVIKEQK
jgi:hypothetical protein